MRLSSRLALTLALTACGGGDTGPTVTPPRPAIQSVSLSPAGSLQLGVGDTLRFTATVNRAPGAPGAPAPELSWRVSAPTLATVTRDGLLTATAPGTFSLIAIASTPASGAFRADSMSTTVLVSSLPPALTSLDVQPGILTTAVGNIVHFDPQLVTAAPNVQVTWSYQLQQPSLGSVDVDGVITTYFAGNTAVRLAATGSAPGYQTTTLVATRTLNIIPAPALSIFDVPSSITVSVGGTVSIPMTVVVPRNAPTPVITLSDYPPGTITTSGGDADWTVTGVRVGAMPLTFRAVALQAAGYYAITRTVTTTVTVVP